MVDIRQPRNEGLPPFEVMGLNRHAYRAIEMLYQRLGATQDQPFEDHMAGRDNQAQIEEIKDDIRRVREDSVASSEDVRGEALNEIGRVIDEIRGRVRELEERPIISDILDDLMGRINDIAANTQQVETGLREKIDELTARFETEAINQETARQSVAFDAQSQDNLTTIEQGAAGFAVYNGASNRLEVRTFQAGTALAITNANGSGGSPEYSVDITVAAPTITTITGSGADADINANFSALETAVNSLRSELGT